MKKNKCYDLQEKNQIDYHSNKENEKSDERIYRFGVAMAIGIGLIKLLAGFTNNKVDSNNSEISDKIYDLSTSNYDKK